MTTTSANTKYLIAGLGVTGQSCARYFQAHGIAFDLWDTRESLQVKRDEYAAAYPNADIVLGSFEQQRLHQYQAIVVSPGLSLTTAELVYAKQQGIQLTNDIELFRAQTTKPIIGITGTNGKSTVTELAAHLLNQVGIRACAVGNVGVPVLDALTDDADIDAYVLELSSYQLEVADQLVLDVAVFLNISEDHMDRYASLVEYTAAKQSIFNAAKQVVYNLDDHCTHPDSVVPNTAATFSMHSTQADFCLGQYQGSEWIFYQQVPLCDTAQFHLSGQHNYANAMAALAAVVLLQSQHPTHFIAALAHFQGLHYRCEFLANIGGVKVYNDSKGTNVGATLAAITGLAAEVADSGTMHLLAGGQGKDQDFSPLADVSKQQALAWYLFGEDQQVIASALNEKVTLVDDMAAAFAAAQASSTSGDVILLSPACASFDQFPSYAVRGARFTELVAEVANG